MSKLDNRRLEELHQIFGSRLSLRQVERKLYGHDIAAMPGLMKLFIGDTIPEAVVQPETEEELVELVRWASQHRLPRWPALDRPAPTQRTEKRETSEPSGNMTDTTWSRPSDVLSRDHQ